MQVRDVMTEGVVTIDPDATVRDAARVMHDSNVGSLPVRRAGSDVEGVLTDRDLVLRCMAVDCDPQTVAVGDIMTRGAAYCYEDEDVGGAAKAMVERGVRRILVFERETDQMKGIVSLADLAVRAEDPEASAIVLNDITQRREAA